MRCLVGGYLYLGAYSADTLKVGGWRSETPAMYLGCPETQINDMAAGDLGSAVFSPGGTIAGCHPCLVSCDAIPTIAMTWSRIKSVLVTDEY